MTEQKSFTRTKTFLICPCCNEATNSIDHLIRPESTVATLPFTGKWHCGNKSCGKMLKFTINTDRQVTSVEEVIEESPAIAVYDLLVLPPQKEPVYFILKTQGYRYNNDEERFRNNHYFYEEHTCPTNWTRDIVAIISEGDADPHGLFEFVLRQTKEEVKDAGVTDESNHMDNEEVINFMDTFYPQYAGNNKNMGMVEEVVINPDSQKLLPN